MSDTVGRLTVVLDARIAQFEAKVAKAEQRLTRGATTMKRDTKQVEASFDGLATKISMVASRLPFLQAALAGLSAGALVQLTRNSVNSVAQLELMAQRAGVTTDALQALGFAATQVGLSTDDLQDGLQELTLKLGEALRGEQEAQEAFTSLGVAFRDVEGRARPTQAVLTDLVARFSEIEDPAQRAAAAARIFGDDLAARMVPFLAQGNEQLRQMVQRAFEFGAVADASLIAKAREATTRIDAMTSAFGSLARNLMAEVAPALTAFANAAQRLLFGPSLTERIAATRAEVARLQAQMAAGPEASPLERSEFAGGLLEGSSLAAVQSALRERQAELERLLALEAELQARVGAVTTGQGAPAPSEVTVTAPRASGGARGTPRDPTMDDFNRALAERTRLIEQNRTPEEAYAARLERLGQLVEYFRGTDQEIPLPTIEAEAADALSDYESALRRVGEAAEENQISFRDLSTSITQGFEDAVLNGAKLRDVMQGLIQDIARLAIRKAVLSGFSLLPFAKGAAFSGGNVVPFAAGGVVGGPTLFPMAGGRTGLMGEAGPEAIMPLTRGPDGKLGVRARGGGGVVINQSLTFGSDVSRAEMARYGEQIKRQTIEAITEARRESAAFLA